MHTVVVVWSLLVLMLAIAAVVGILTHKRPSYDKVESSKGAFDFSPGLAEAKETCRVLAASLADSTTDDEFAESYKRHCGAPTDYEAEAAWSSLERQLVEHRLGHEWSQTSRSLASRYLTDISRRYKFAEPASAPNEREDYQ